MKKKFYTLCILACLLNPAIVSSGRPITDELGSEHTDDLNNITDNKNHDGLPGLAQVKISQSPIAAAETSPVKTASNPAKKSITKNNDIALSAKFTIEELTDYRQQFLEAEKALAKNNFEKYFLLADELKDYPLYPYLQYKWLKKNLDQEVQIKQYLDQNQTSRYAPLLKRKWLHHLAENKQWQNYLQFYSKTKDVVLQCYQLQAQYETGDKETALIAASELWNVGYSQPKKCRHLFRILKKSNHFNQDLFWKRFDLTLRNHKTNVAAYIRKLMAKEHHATADLWINLHNNAEKYLPKLLSTSNSSQSALMFSHAISRLANKDINLATTIWDNNKHRFSITKNRADEVEKKLALKLAYRKHPAAFDRLGQLDDADNKSNTLRVRVALAEQNWPNVITAIQALSHKDKKHERWQYWLARAYLETDNDEKADRILSMLSTKRSFYGYLAADRVNSIYHLSDIPLEISSQEIDNIKYRNDFSIAYEFKMLEREIQAKYQWWHAIKQLNEDEIKAAAKLAQQWEWDEIAIFTIAKVKYWDDVELRFPLSYSEKIHKNAAKQDLNPAILFGLIRRESAFHKKAHSPVGARGLMQIMPNTGRQIAKDLKQRWRGKNSLYNPDRNIKYGAYYYKKLVNDFKGNYALALAAYNAGPSRVKKWLPDETLPADIWIELIPFKETREYVSKVLGYAMIYQLRHQSNQLSMADLTRDVHPDNIRLVQRSY